MTDNGSCYRGFVHQLACRSLGVKHLRTRPYRPHTNGKAERFIRTLLRGWAYAAIYRHSAERRRALDGWLDYYNRQRRHAASATNHPYNGWRPSAEPTCWVLQLIWSEVCQVGTA